MHRGASLAAGTVHLGDVERDTVRQIDVAVDERVSTRLRARDASLWSADPDTTELISQRLGWVDGPTRVDPVSRAAGPVLLLGMGGSSLGALALAAAHGVDDGLHVLDSTVPATVQAATRRKFSGSCSRAISRRNSF